MVFEQMLTVFFAAGVGVAIVLYATRSRRSVAPSIIGQGAAVRASYVATESVQASVVDAPVVEASSVPQSQIVNDIPSATSEVATPTEAAAVVAAPVVEAMAPIIAVEPTVMMESQASQEVSATTAAEAPAQTMTATTEKPRRVRSTRRRSSGTASTRTRARTASEKSTEQTS